MASKRSLRRLLALNHAPGLAALLACLVSLFVAASRGGATVALGAGVVAVALLAAYAVAAYLVVRATHDRLAARIADIVQHADQLESGDALPALVPQADDALGRLEALLGDVAERIAQRDRVLRADARRQQLDAQIQRAVGMADSEADVVEIAGRALAMVVPESPAEILLVDPRQSQLQLSAISATGASPGCPVETPSGCAALRRGQTLRFHDSDALDACPRLRKRPDGKCAALCVPLSVMGRAIGVLHVTTAVEQPLSEQAVNALESVATHVGARLGMLDSLATFQTQASLDPLTGLLNRRSFEEAAGRVLRDGQQSAVVVADLDHFKRLNDEHGHEVGDRALKLFAQVLRQNLRPTDIVGRMGGEEFVAVLPRCDPDDADLVLDRLRGALAHAVANGGGPRFTASFGVAEHPRHGETLASLISAADRALYESKRAGRDRVTRFAELGAAPAAPEAHLLLVAGMEGSPMQ
jgi:diguanylate cyclase (GGDEF)-like protein